ncbi:MinD/ParA family ATP-binding protein [Naumannella halotolerans]|uniref:MinD-like ATPase involved in chromosome partitioning or flagellar assembly n=1 Tax=Naumannella halotolerans TaxID=993414 RepID=A0A4R7IYW9_9ACTN|nr:hypothetical protein [Naumannella halotolerans]TDT29920.1 MinD-like ATPase involved in chromosome partitioning or flagellar assembly [Naumannella halotolerans]
MTEPDSPHPRRSWPSDDPGQPDGPGSTPQRGLAWPVLPQDSYPSSQPTPSRPESPARGLPADAAAAEGRLDPDATHIADPAAVRQQPGPYGVPPQAGTAPGGFSRPGPDTAQAPAPHPGSAGAAPENRPWTGPQAPPPFLPAGPQQGWANPSQQPREATPSSPFSQSGGRSAPEQQQPQGIGARLRKLFGGRRAEEAERRAREEEARAREEARRADQEAAERAERERVERLAAEEAEQKRAQVEAVKARRHKLIDTPVRHHLVTVSSLKGGVTKTTVVLALGTAMALHRRDLVLAIDGNAHRGTLAGRLGEETSLTVRDLVATPGEVTTATDFRRFTSQAESRFEVLASESNPLQAQGFSAEEYSTALRIAKTFRSVILTDTGTDLTLPLMTEVYQNTDTLVVPATTAYDGAVLAWETLDWWEDQADPELVRNAIVPVTQIEPLALPLDLANVDADRLAELREEYLVKQAARRQEILDRFGPRVGEVIFVPYDPSLRAGGMFDWQGLSPESQEAYEKVAEAVARRFAREEAEPGA